MTPVWGMYEAVVRFVADRCQCRPDFGNCQTLAVLSGGKIVGGVVFHNWSPETGVIEISAAGDRGRWVSPRVLKEVFNYAFITASCQMVVARIAEDNEAARNLWKSLGSDEILIPRLRGRTASEAIELLTQEAWQASRFNRSSNVKAQSPKAA